MWGGKTAGPRQRLRRNLYTNAPKTMRRPCQRSPTPVVSCCGVRDVQQVRAFSEDLSFVAVERWKRDAAAVAGSMIGLARLFFMLRFHPRLSLVTDVLAASGVHLVHFFIMFFMVVGVYRYVGCPKFCWCSAVQFLCWFFPLFCWPPLGIATLS